MFCPKCGRDCGEGGYCVSCNNKAPNIKSVDTKLEPPIGIYKVSYAYIELGVKTVTFHKKLPFEKEYERVVAYDQISQVVYEPGKGLTAGYLAIRERKDITRPIATREDALHDQTAIRFICSQNEEFYRIYEFFKHCAEKENAAYMLQSGSQPSLNPVPKKNGHAPSLDYYYRRYNPSRTEAIMALRRDTGMGLVEAKKCIDYIFDYYELGDGAKGIAFTDKAEELESADKLYCPRCLSERVYVGKKGFDYLGGWSGERLFPGVGFLLGAIGANDLQCKCLKCGFTWEP